MSTFTVLPFIPAPIPEDKFAQNNDINMGQSLRRVASAYNYVSAHQRKQVFTHAQPNTISPASADVVHQYFVFRTGENVASIDAILALRSSSTATSAASYVELILNDGTNTLTSDKVYYPITGLLANDVRWMRTRIAAADGLLPNTVYRGWIRQANYCRVKAISVFETGDSITDSTVTGVSDPLNWETFNPITDAGVQDLAECGTSLFRHNGLQLLSWSRQTEGYAPTVSTTTPVNILDTSVTAWSATSPGFTLNTEFLGSYSGDVKLELGVYATRTGVFDTLTITVLRNGGTVLTASGIASTMTPCEVSAHSITARASDKIDIMMSTSGTDTWRLDALGLWLYEA